MRVFIASVAASLCFYLASSDAKAQPSFQCAAAKTALEKTICSNKTLSEMDLEMAHAFSDEKKSLAEPYLGMFLREQKSWLSGRSTSCEAEAARGEHESKDSDLAACLINKYRDRINYIYSLIALKGGWIQDVLLNGEVFRVVFLSETSDKIDTFRQRYNSEKHTNVSLNCKNVINVVAGNANNYGAICLPFTGKPEERLAVCADDMVGNFHSEVIGQRPLSTEELASFVLSHCTGG